MEAELLKIRNSLENLVSQINTMLGTDHRNVEDEVFDAIPKGGCSISDLNRTSSFFRSLSTVRKRLVLADLEDGGKIETFKVKSTANAKRSATMIYRVGSNKKPNQRNHRDEDY